MPFVIDVVAPPRGVTLTLVTNPLRTLTMDMLSADFGPEASVTEHPVELGSEVSDHVQIKALRFSVEAWVTESPLSAIPAILAVQSAVSFLNSVIGQLLVVSVSGEGTFSSMLLESFSHHRSSVEGRGFGLRFKQLRIASALSVKIPPGVPAAAAAVGAPTELPLGQQATSAAANVSVLKDIKDTVSPAAFLSSLFGFH
jgi:hypothetical protein